MVNGFWFCFIVLCVVCRFFCCCCCCFLYKKSHKYTVSRALHTHSFTFWFIGCSASTVVLVWCEHGTFQAQVNHSCFTGDWSKYLPLFYSWAVSQGEGVGCLLKWKSYCSELRQNMYLNCCRNLGMRAQRKMHHMLGHNLKKYNISNLYFKKPRRIKCFLQAYSIILQGFGYWTNECTLQRGEAMEC